MHIAKELSHSDVPFIYSFFKTIVAQTSDKFTHSQTDHTIYATRHAKLTLRPEIYVIAVEFDNTKILYNVKKDLAFIFSQDEEMPSLGNMEKLFTMILREARF